MTSKEQVVTRHWDRMSRLKAWAGTIAHKKLQREADRQERNLEAEDRSVRQGFWGAKKTEEPDDMGDTILGDVTQNITQPQPPQKQGGGLKAALLGAGLTAVGGPIAAAAGMYVYDKLTTDDPAPIVQPIDPVDADTDTRVRLRLRKGGE